MRSRSDGDPNYNIRQQRSCINIRYDQFRKAMNSNSSKEEGKHHPSHPKRERLRTTQWIEPRNRVESVPVDVGEEAVAVEGEARVETK